MGERTRGFAITALRFCLVGLGMLGQRLTHGAEIAMPPYIAAQVPGGEQISEYPVLLSQSQPISGIHPSDESSAATAGSSTDPVSATQESTSFALMPSSGQKRRRPKMAGIPEGLKQTILLPESSADTQLAGPNEGGITGGASLVGTTDSTGDESGTLDIEDENSPGAIASRRAFERGEGRSYKLAPIRWRGTVFDMLAWKRSRYWGKNTITKTTNGVPVTRSGPPDLFVNIKGALIQASTFIMHPWVASVAGRLGVVSQQLRYKGVQDFNNHQLMGGGKLFLFPLSRYPFTMTYDLNDSRATTEFTDTINEYDNVTNKLTLLQKYRPKRGLDRYEYGYDYNKSDFTNYAVNLDTLNDTLYKGTYTYTNLHGNYTSRLGKKHDQPFLMYGSHETTTQSSIPGGGQIRDNIRANHVYTPEEYLLTLKNNASFFQSRFKTNTSQNLQFGSEATWQPEALDNPLILNGSARIYMSRVENGSASHSAKILRANVRAVYNKWAHLYLSGGGTLTATNANGNSSLSSTQFGHAVYKPGWTTFKSGLRYEKWAEAGFVNRISSKGGSNLSTFAGASHTMSSKRTRRRIFDYDLQVATAAHQSLYVRTDQNRGTSETLVNQASVSWIPFGLRSRLPSVSTTSGQGVTGRASGATNLISSVGIFARDTRVYGNNPSHSQSFRLSMGAGAGAAYVASASGYGANADLSIDYSRNTGGGSYGGLTGRGSWGHRFVYYYRYRKANVFNVKRLSYQLAFNAMIDPELRARRQISFTTSRDIASNSERLSYGTSLVQTLGYRIGQNEALLSASIADNYGINTASLILRFRAWRNFGN